MKSNEYADDQDIYQYIRMHTDEMELGNGTLKLSTFGRIADDMNGYADKDWEDRYFYSQRDALDTELENNDLAPRLYYGYAKFDGVVKNTSATLGRFYLEHLNSFQLDGADANIKVTDMINVYAFGGKPVSYYYDLNDASVFGGGVAVNYQDRTKITAEYSRLDIEDIDDDYSMFRLVQFIPNGSILLDYSILNDTGTLEGNIDYEMVTTGTIITLGYKGQYDEADSGKTYVVNPLTYALLPQSKYNKYSASAYQAFLKYFVIGANYETKIVDGEENFDNRNYNRYGVKFDVNGLPSEHTYISFSADKWDVDSNSSSDDNSRIHYSLHIDQELTEELGVWIGTSFSRYEYDYSLDKRKDSVRSYYIGGEYQPAEIFSVMIDLSREDTDLYDDVDSDLETSYTAELWASLIF
jgi:hypothetical protein